VKTLNSRPVALLLLLLTCALPSFAAVTFSGGWENGITAKGNWKYIQSMAADRFQRVASPVRQGSYAARVEVRPGDDPIGSSGERAEVLVMTDAAGNAINESLSSGTQYYGFSVRLDSAWTPPQTGADGNWAIVFQLHGPDVLAASPSVAVSVLKRFSIDCCSGNLDSASQSLRWKSFVLSDSSLNVGHWVDLVLKITFAVDFTGSIVVWRRNEGQTAFSQVLSVNNIPTLQYKSSVGPVAAHYWKHGLYRSKQTTVTNVLWLDGLSRADSFDEVVAAAFGNSAVRYPNDLSSNETSFLVDQKNIGSGIVRFDIGQWRGSVFDLSVVNSSGRTVWEYHPANTDAPEHEVYWRLNCAIIDGFYFVKFRQGNYITTRRFQIVR
jgi:Polysaccharide lyase